MIRQLRARLPDLRRRDGQLARLLEQVELVDGSLLASAATVTWALRGRQRKREGGGDGGGGRSSHVRLDLRLCGATRLPTHVGRQRQGVQRAQGGV